VTLAQILKKEGIKETARTGRSFEDFLTFQRYAKTAPSITTGILGGF
jgi:hypothetical protein